MSITKEELLEKLKLDLSQECTAIMQYVQHSSSLIGTGSKDIQRELIARAEEELQHALLLADQINYLGEVLAVQTPLGQDSLDNKSMLPHIEAANDAIVNYTTRIKQAEELGLYNLAYILREILDAEQAQAVQLMNVLEM